MFEPDLPTGEIGMAGAADLLPTYEDPSNSLSLQDAPEYPDTSPAPPKAKPVFDNEAERLAFEEAMKEVRLKKEREAALIEDSVKSQAEGFLAGFGDNPLTNPAPTPIDVSIDRSSKIDLVSPADKKDSLTELYGPSESSKYRKDEVLSMYSHVDDNLNVSFKPPVTFDGFLASKRLDQKKDPAKSAGEVIGYVNHLLDYYSLEADRTPEEFNAKKEELIDAAKTKMEALALDSSVGRDQGVINSANGKPMLLYKYKQGDRSTVQIYKIGDDGSISGTPDDEIKIPEVTMKALREQETIDLPTYESLTALDKKKQADAVNPDDLPYAPGKSTFGYLGGLVDSMNEQTHPLMDKQEADAQAKKFKEFQDRSRRPSTPIEYAEGYVRDYVKQMYGDVGDSHYLQDAWNGVVSGFGRLAIGFETLKATASPFMGEEEYRARMNELAQYEQGAQALQANGTDLINPTEFQKLASSSATVVGNMAPLIATTLATGGVGALTESGLSVAAQAELATAARTLGLSTMWVQTFGQEYSSRIAQAVALEEQAAQFRSLGKNDEADGSLAEAERLRSTAGVAGIMTAFRETGTEMIFPEEMLIANAAKKGIIPTIKALALSAVQNPIEDMASDVLEIPQRQALGDKIPDVNLLETGAISAMSALALGGAPVVMKGISHTAGAVIPSTGFNLESFGKTADQLNVESETKIATPDNANEFVDSKLDEPVRPVTTKEVPKALVVTDDSGQEFTKQGNAFITKSGNVIPIYETGKGREFLNRLEVEQPEALSSDTPIQDSELSQEEQPAPTDVQGREIPHTYEEAIDNEIKREFPEYKLGNENGVSNIKKTLRPISFIWDGLRNRGYSLRLVKSVSNSGGGLYVDYASKSVVVDLSKLESLRSQRSGSWAAAALNEEALHIATEAAGIDTKELATAAPKEVVDSVIASYGDVIPTQSMIGDEMLRMFIQGKITKNEDGTWKVGGRSITETHYKRYFDVAKDSLAALFHTYGEIESGSNSSPFANLVRESADKVTKSFQEIFGQSLESHQLTKELGADTFTYRAKRKLFDLAGKAADLVEFGVDLILKLGRDLTPEEFTEAETIHSATEAVNELSKEEADVADVKKKPKKRSSMARMFDELDKKVPGFLPFFRMAALKSPLALVDESSFREFADNSGLSIPNNFTGRIFVLTDSAEKEARYDNNAYGAFYGAFTRRKGNIIYRPVADFSPMKSELKKGDLVFSMQSASISDEDRAVLSDAGIYLIAPNRVNVSNLPWKKMEQDILGKNGIQTISLVDEAIKFFKSLNEEELKDIDLPDLPDSTEGMSLDDRVSLARRLQAILSDDTMLYMKFYKAMASTVKLGPSGKLLTKPENGLQSKGQEVYLAGDVGENEFLRLKLWTEYQASLGEGVLGDRKVEPTVLQPFVNLDKGKSFRVTSMNVNGKWVVLSPSTINKSLWRGPFNSPSAVVDAMPVISGEEINQAMEAEEAAFNALSEIDKSKQNMFHGSILSMDMEFDLDSNKWRVIELNPTEEGSEGGQISNFFVVDAALSLLTKKTPLLIRAVRAVHDKSLSSSGEGFHTYKDQFEIGSTVQSSMELLKRNGSIAVFHGGRRSIDANSIDVNTQSLGFHVGTRDQAQWVSSKFKAFSNGEVSSFALKDFSGDLHVDYIDDDAAWEHPDVLLVDLVHYGFFNPDDALEIASSWDGEFSESHKRDFVNAIANAGRNVLNKNFSSNDEDIFSHSLNPDFYKNKKKLAQIREFLVNEYGIGAIIYNNHVEGSEVGASAVVLDKSMVSNVSKNNEIRLSSSGEAIRKKKLSFPRYRTVSQRKAYNHTYKNYPVAKDLISKVYYKYLSKKDRISLDEITSPDSVKKADVPAIETILRGIKERGDKAWYKDMQSKFGEILTGKDFAAVYDSDPQKVKEAVRAAFTLEKDGGTDTEKMYEGATGKRRQKLIDDLKDHNDKGLAYLKDEDDKFIHTYEEMTSRQQAQIVNGIELVSELAKNVESLTTSEIARLNKIMQGVAEGDFFGFHDLLSKFRAKVISNFAGEYVAKNGDVFSDPVALLNKPIYKMGARIESIFRYSKAKKFFQAIYGIGDNASRPNGSGGYMVDVDRYHVRISAMNNEIGRFFEYNRATVDSRIEAGVAAILTQYRPSLGAAVEFNKRVAEMNHSISVMENGDISLKAKSASVKAAFNKLMKGVDPSLVIDDASAYQAIAQVESNVSRPSRKLLEFARNNFASQKNEAKYVKTVVFGEAFHDIENYVHLVPKSTMGKDGEKGNVTKSLGTQETALKQRKGISLDSSNFYEPDIGVMMFDGMSDHMYEFETAYNRLLLSHLHNRSADKVNLGFRSVFSRDKATAARRHDAVTTILEEIHHGITASAYHPGGLYGVLFGGAERVAVVYNSMKILNIDNIPAQFVSAIAGLGVYVGSGKISPNALGKALMIISHMYKPGEHNIRNIINAMSPGVVARRENPDAQLEYAKEGSASVALRKSKHHKNIGYRMASLGLSIATAPLNLASDVVSNLVRFINGSPDGAAASISFLAGYIHNYQKINNTTLSSIAEIRAALQEVDFRAVNAANEITDKIMGNPSNPEQRARLFQAKTSIQRLMKSVLFLFRQTTVGFGSTTANGLKAAFWKGGELSKEDISIRINGMADALAGYVNMVVFPLIKSLWAPTLITTVLFNLLSKRDDELSDEEKKLKEDALKMTLIKRKVKTAIERDDIIASSLMKGEIAHKGVRNNLIQFMQMVIPFANNSVGDVASKIAFDKVFAKDADKYWLQQQARLTANRATIAARTPKNKEEQEIKDYNLFVYDATLELIKMERRGDAKMFNGRTSYGGSASSILEIAAMISEIDSDEPFLKQIRDMFLSSEPQFRDALEALKKADKQSDKKEKVDKKANETRIKLDEIAPIGL